MVFILTDGQSNRKVKATENQPIIAINKFLLPGTKIMLKGKVNYINQTIQLHSKNVEILGGIVPGISTISNLINELRKLM